MFIRSKKKRTSDRVEERFQTVVGLIRDLDKKEFNRLKSGMELAWQAYSKVREVKSQAEKEVEDIEESEQILGEEEWKK